MQISCTGDGITDGRQIEMAGLILFVVQVLLFMQVKLHENFNGANACKIKDSTGHVSWGASQKHMGKKANNKPARAPQPG